MVVRMLNLCGLYLGEEQDMLPKAADNPEGFWEHVGFFNINEVILSQLGGSWHRPPALPAGWEGLALLDHEREEARQLVASMQSHYDMWGWKDPRNSLMLPFWQSLVPDLKAIICLRNPLDVARSLAKRNRFTEALGIDLWQTYSESALASVRPENRLITHYNSYFSDPRAELERVLKFVGIAATEAMLEEACATVSQSLQHNHETIENLICAGAPAEAIRLYAQMCLDCGPVYWKSIEGAESASTGEQAAQTPKPESESLRRLTGQDPAMDVVMEQLANRDRAIRTLKIQLAQQEERTAEQEQRTADLQTQLSALQMQASAIQNSISWRLTRPLRGLKRKGSLLKERLQRFPSQDSK